MKKLIICLFVFFMISSCEEKVDLEIPPGDITRLVVDGMITNERTSHWVKLSLPVKSLNQAPIPVSNAIVAITDQESIFLLEEDPLEPGTYRTEPDVQGVTGKLYTLYIRILNYEFTANSYMVPVEPLRDPVIWRCPDKDNYFHVIPRSSGDPFMLQISGDWSNTDECTGEGSCHSLFNHYHINSIDVNEFFKEQKETVCLPAGTLVTRKKFSLNPQHQEFIRSLLIETEWRGEIFDVEKGNVITNLSSGGTGYFAASTIDTDTFILE